MSAKNYYIHGDVSVSGGWENNTSLNDVVANIVSSENGVKTDLFTNIVMDKPSADGKEDSYIYERELTQYLIKELESIKGIRVVKTYDEDKLVVLNLAGVSTVKDICYGSGASQQCLSDRIRQYYDSLQAQLEAYLTKMTQAVTPSSP